VVFGGICRPEERWLAALRRARIEWRVVCKSTSLSAMQSAVEAGLGVAIERNIRRDTMRILDPAANGLPPPSADFGLFCLADPADAPPAVRALQEYLFHELRPTVPAAPGDAVVPI
jgi:DNA-binding transcriptional LysR family regulator